MRLFKQIWLLRVTSNIFKLSLYEIFLSKNKLKINIIVQIYIICYLIKTAEKALLFVVCFFNSES